jgi:hypothetical protein
MVAVGSVLCSGSWRTAADTAGEPNYVLCFTIVFVVGAETFFAISKPVPLLVLSALWCQLVF